MSSDTLKENQQDSIPHDQKGVNNKEKRNKPKGTFINGACTILLATLTILGWILVWVLQTVFKFIAFPFTSVEHRQDVCGWLFRGVNYFLLDIMNPLWSTTGIRPWDRKKMKQGKPFMFMFNHLSNADPWLCIRLMFPTDCKWVCKGSLFKVPFGGWCLRNNGDLEVKFVDNKSSRTVKGSTALLMEQATRALRRHQPLAIFPEGTRSHDADGPLYPFKRGFFDLAVAEGAQIVPVAWSGNQTCWPVGGWQFAPATTYASVGDPIDPDGHTGQSLMEECWKVITEMREQHPDRVALRKKKDLQAAQ